MKERKYLDVRVTRWNGETFSNPLKLSEVYLISRLAKENKELKVQCITCTDDYYKTIFS